MNRTGQFTVQCRRRGVVTKHLASRHPDGYRFAAAMTATGEHGMRNYLRTLREVGVRLPGRLRQIPITPPTIEHRWVNGPVLTDLAVTDPEIFAAAVAQIAQWVCDLDTTDARIDTNLANYCVDRGTPVLVDVLPPLIPSLRPVPETLFDVLFHALCFDTRTTIDALLGYALRALLTPPRAITGASGPLLLVAERFRGKPRRRRIPGEVVRRSPGRSAARGSRRSSPRSVRGFFRSDLDSSLPAAQ